MLPPLPKRAPATVVSPSSGFTSHAQNTKTATAVAACNNLACNVATHSATQAARPQPLTASSARNSEKDSHSDGSAQVGSSTGMQHGLATRATRSGSKDSNIYSTANAFVLPAGPAVVTQGGLSGTGVVPNREHARMAQPKTAVLVGSTAQLHLDSQQGSIRAATSRGESFASPHTAAAAPHDNTNQGAMLWSALRRELRNAPVNQAAPDVPPPSLWQPGVATTRSEREPIDQFASNLCAVESAGRVL
jgi:hypothetical protein